jgi:hypothetical protein
MLRAVEKVGAAHFVWLLLSVVHHVVFELLVLKEAVVVHLQLLERLIRLKEEE